MPSIGSLYPNVTLSPGSGCPLSEPPFAMRIVVPIGFVLSTVTVCGRV